MWDQGSRSHFTPSEPQSLGSTNFSLPKQVMPTRSYLGPKSLIPESERRAARSEVRPRLHWGPQPPVSPGWEGGYTGRRGSRTQVWGACIQCHLEEFLSSQRKFCRGDMEMAMLLPPLLWPQAPVPTAPLGLPALGMRCLGRLFLNQGLPDLGNTRRQHPQRPWSFPWRGSGRCGEGMAPTHRPWRSPPTEAFRPPPACAQEGEGPKCWPGSWPVSKPLNHK